MEYTYNFERKEIKYILTEEQYVSLLLKLRGFYPDEHGQTLIQNIYYDTPDFSLIKRSLEHPTYKEKLRIRKYGTEGNIVFIEIKKKYNGIVYKRRMSGLYEQSMAQIGQGKAPGLLPEHKKEEEQIQREIGYFVRHYKTLRPAMKVSYYRTAYKNDNLPDFRITFDENIRWNSEAVDFSENNDNRLFDITLIIMEVKTKQNYDYAFAHILSELEIFPVSFSKYGRCYLVKNK